MQQHVEPAAGADGLWSTFWSSGFMPHGHCYLWQPGLVWLHAGADLGIALAYTAIPMALAAFVSQRPDVPFRWMFLLFGAFIATCGLTHYLAVWNLWHGTYWLSGSIKAGTALLSVVTAVLLFRFIPLAQRIPFPSELQRARAATAQAAERLRAVMESNLDALFLVVPDAAGSLLLAAANDMGLRLLGLRRLRGVGLPLASLLPEHVFAALLPKYRDVVAGRRVIDEEVSAEVRGGQIRWFRHLAMPTGEGLVITARDITEHRQAAQARARLAAIVASSDDAIYSRTLSGVIDSWNAGAERLYGYSAAEVLGRPFHILIPPGQQADLPGLMRRLLDGDNVPPFETVRRRRDGELVDVSLALSPIKDEHGHVIGTSAIARDISRAKRAQRQLQASLAEKDLLLKEVHHRVKNNLQIISSLLSLQSDQAHDAGTQRALQESQDRVRAIAIFHEQLYRSESLAEVDMQRYLRSLVDHLMTAYGIDTQQLDVVVRARGISLGVDAAIPVALIVNELLSNVIKHAFPQGERGTARVEMVALSDGDAQLTVQDSGVGLPPGVGVETATTLGLQIVAALMRQLGGQLVPPAAVTGTVFTMRFAPTPGCLPGAPATMSSGHPDDPVQPPERSV